MAPDPLRPLVDAALDGDDRAVAELVLRTQPDLWRLCSALGSAGETEDLVQETYLRALGSIDRYRGDAPVRTWLLAIGRHVCADHVRRRQRQRRIVERIVATTPADPGEPGPGPIDDLLDGLDANRREAFVLTQMLGLTYDEAAEVIGCPVGTIRSRVTRARADLMDAVHRSEAAGG